MRRNIILATIIVVAVIITAVYFLQKTTRGIINFCYADSDCKLIYSNCDCEAVPINDPRTSLENDAICKWNICHGTNVTAICINNGCFRSDQ